ncbi:hypothetical protein [Bartonella sp. B39]
MIALRLKNETGKLVPKSLNTIMIMVTGETLMMMVYIVLRE